MGRQARSDAEGVIQHVISRGLNREAIFREQEDYEDLLSRLKYLTRETGMRVHAWSFLPNHFHLLTETGRTPLATFIRRALTGYSLFFNQKYGRVGYLFQGRYKSKVAWGEDYRRALFVYVNMNPFKHGIVRSTGELERYPWCGHKEIMAPGANDLSCLRESSEMFSDREMYRESTEVKTQLHDGELSAGRENPVVSGRADRADLEATLLRIAEAHGVSVSAISGRGRTCTISRAREEFLRIAVRLQGYTLSEAAGRIGLSLPSACSALARAGAREKTAVTDGVTQMKEGLDVIPGLHVTPIN